MFIKHIFKTRCHCVGQLTLELQGSPICARIVHVSHHAQLRSNNGLLSENSIKSSCKFLFKE